MPQFCEVAVNAPLHEPLTYEIPSSLLDQIEIGTSVMVPLGQRSSSGVVLKIHGDDSKINFETKPIQSPHETRPRLNLSQIRWGEFLARYYVHPIGQVFESFFSPLPNYREYKSQKRQLLGEWNEKKSIAPELTVEQATVVKNIIEAGSDFQTHLIFGVTGSGKTEVYIRVIESVLKQNKSALILVPEISLTPQLVDRFLARFGENVAVIHSHLTDREKTNQWWLAHNGKCKILIGARSALFCPIPNLGVIIVDEEHEASFKQDEMLKYNARDASIMRAKFENCPVLLGSATPSLESWSNAKSGRFHLHRLSQRVADRPLPHIEIINLKPQGDDDTPIARNTALPFWMSEPLYIALAQNFKNRKQSALFLNRRGVAQSVVGEKTSKSPHCPNCDIGLTLHANHYLVCHYCDYSISENQLLKQLNETALKPIGVGTEQVEIDLQNLFPSARIARADRDEITTREGLEDLIRQTESGEVDFLVGTQMIAKGLDFPSLTLVGIVLADVGFNLPDFRACERSFQLLCQVSGRPGRHESSGRVLIQTLNPLHPALAYVQNHDFESFADFELLFRQQLKYPPSYKMVCLRLQGMDKQKTRDHADQIAGWVQSWISKNSSLADVQVLGPATAPLSKIRNQYRFHILLKAPKIETLQSIARQILVQLKKQKISTKVLIDVDPQNLM